MKKTKLIILILTLVAVAFMSGCEENKNTIEIDWTNNYSNYADTVKMDTIKSIWSGNFNYHFINVENISAANDIAKDIIEYKNGALTTLKEDSSQSYPDGEYDWAVLKNSCKLTIKPNVGSYTIVAFDLIDNLENP